MRGLIDGAGLRALGRTVLVGAALLCASAGVGAQASAAQAMVMASIRLRICQGLGIVRCGVRNESLSVGALVRAGILLTRPQALSMALS